MLRIVSAALQGTARRLTSLPIKSQKCSISPKFIKPQVAVAGFEAQSRYASFYCLNAANRKNEECRNFSTLLSSPTTTPILSPEFQIAKVPARTVIKFSRYKGKRMTEKEVIRRFYRLNWGIWIRTKAGRHKRLWTKTLERKRRLRRHVFTTAAQSYLLDKMVTRFWRRPKYYVDDPYNPYHTRESFPHTRTKPLE